MLRKEFDFILEDELIYSYENEAKIVAKRLLLRAPTTRLLTIAGALNAVVMSAFFEARKHFPESKQHSANARSDVRGKKKAPDDEKSNELDGSGIYMFISSSLADGDKMENFLDNFNTLLLSDGICLVDGKAKMTQTLLDSLDSRETIRLIGDYIANFLLPSIMQPSKKKN